MATGKNELPIPRDHLTLAAQIYLRTRLVLERLTDQPLACGIARGDVLSLSVAKITTRRLKAVLRWLTFAKM
jgi:hypothetical protein